MGYREYDAGRTCLIEVILSDAAKLGMRDPFNKKRLRWVCSRGNLEKRGGVSCRRTTQSIQNMANSTSIHSSQDERTSPNCSVSRSKRLQQYEQVSNGIVSLQKSGSQRNMNWRVVVLPTGEKEVANIVATAIRKIFI